jgi:BirA family transcriptional regulator, biotin operon repressor / biotin---[acetyl-CoA-carboxylase] ligase
MNEGRLREALSSIPIGQLRYFDSIGSTNDEALTWASQGATDLSMVIADEQTAGRGRSRRKWITPPGAALALSLILRPSDAELSHPSRVIGLGALALTDLLLSKGLTPKIKWPNDILIHSRKVAGMLVESVWSGDVLLASVLGMGVNVLKASAPPEDALNFPATSIEAELGSHLDRLECLMEILSALIKWRKKLGTDEFILAWGHALAFQGEQVQIIADQREPLYGELIGLEPDGQLIIRTAGGHLQKIAFGEMHLRPAL